MHLIKGRRKKKCYIGYLPVKLYFTWLAFVTGALITCSCNNYSNNSRLRAYYSGVVDSAYYLFNIGKQEVAFKYLNSAHIPYQYLNFNRRLNYYYLRYYYYFLVKNDDKSAMLCVDSTLNLFDNQDKKRMYLIYYVKAVFNKGDILFKENKFNEAYKFYYQGKRLADKGLNNCALGDFSYRMGMIMYKQGHFSQGAVNFKNSLKETAECGLNSTVFWKMQEMFDNTGLCYSKLDMLDSALAYYKKGLDYIDKEGTSFLARKTYLDMARGVIYGNQANIYIKRNDLPLAKKMLKISISLNLMKGNDNKDAELTELKLAHLYFNTNALDSLINLLSAVRGQLDTVKNKDAEADWNFLMANYYVAKNNTRNAVNYFIRYNSLKDSVETQDRILKDADVSRQIKSMEKDYQMDDLKKSNESQRFYLMLTLILALLLIIITLLILLNWQKSKKNIKTLGSLNNKINEQNKNLENALTELKLSSQEKDRILRTVAHDLRNPIGGIASLTLVMADDNYDESQKEMIGLIRETSKNSLELINEILEAANNGPDKLNKELVEINGLITHSVELLRFKALEKEQKIILGLLDKPGEIYISREKIWRVINNLITNAIKFSPAGSAIFVKVKDLGGEVEISVKDNGIGIPDKFKNKVFNMFTDAKRPGTAGEKSFGLGLSISKQIVENHNGKIWFESFENSGTTFFITLPKVGSISH